MLKKTMDNIKKSIQYLSNDEKRDKRFRKKKHPFRMISIIILVFIVSGVFKQKELYSVLADFLHEKLTPKSIATVSLIEMLPLQTLTKISVISVNASSYLSTTDTTYDAEKLIDGNVNTSWQDGVDGFGENENLTFKINNKENVCYIIIYNGNQISDEHFYNNNRVKDMVIVINGVEKDITLPDSKDAQVIQIDCNTAITSIEFIIKSVYAGIVYNDTCISEVEFYK